MKLVKKVLFILFSFPVLVYGQEYVANQVGKAPSYDTPSTWDVTYEISNGVDTFKQTFRFKDEGEIEEDADARVARAVEQRQFELAEMAKAPVKTEGEIEEILIEKGYLKDGETIEGMKTLAELMAEVPK